MTWQNYQRNLRRGRPRDDGEDGGDEPDPLEGTYTVEVGTDEYFDPNATSDQWPGVVGLNMRTHHWWQGDDAWDTYEELGPGDDSINTGDPNAAGDQGGGADDGTPPGGTPGDPRIRTDVPSVNGIPLTWCEEDGILGDLIGSETNTIQILLQGVQDIGDFWFPVNPEELSAQFGEDNDYDTDVIGVGEIVIPGTSKLESVGWSSFLPERFDDGYVSIPAGLLHDPSYAMQKLIETKRQRLVCFLIIGGTPWNDYVVIKSLKWTTRAGEPGDLYYDIEFKRFRDVTIQTVDVPGAGVEDPRDAPSSQGTKQGQGDDKKIPTNDNPDGHDGTNTQHVDVNDTPTVGAAAASGVDTGTEGSRSRQGNKRRVQDNYPVGYNQSLQDVFEDLTRQNNGPPENTLASLIEDNKDSPVTIFSTGTPYNQGQPAGIGPLLGGPKYKVSDFAPNEPLPMGTFIKYWKWYKVAPTPSVQEPAAGSGAAIAKGGPVVTATEGSPAAAILGGHWPWDPKPAGGGGGFN